MIRRLREGITKHSKELIDDPDTDLSYSDTFKLMQSILSSQLTSEQEQDVRQWFNELATTNRADGKKRMKAKIDGPLLQLFERCQRKRS